MKAVRIFMAVGAFCALTVFPVRGMTVNGVSGQGNLATYGWTWDGYRLGLDSACGVQKFVIKGSSTDWVDAVDARLYRPSGASVNGFELEIMDGVFTESFGMNRLDSNVLAQVSLTVYGGDFRCVKDPFVNYAPVVITGGDFAFDPIDYVPEDIPVFQNGNKWLVGRVNLGFDPAGGEVSVMQKTLKYGDSYGELPIPTREGYAFAAWQIGGEDISAEDRCFLHEATIAIARWTEIIEPEEAPTLFFSQDDLSFSGGLTYNGWIRGDDGEITGTIVIRTGKKKKDGVSKPTVFYTPAGGRKRNVKIPVDQYPQGGDNATMNIPGIGTVLLSGRSVSGVDVNIQAGADLSKDKTRKADYNARLAALVGTRTFAVGTESGCAAFSVVVDRKGKGKLTGTLPNGAKITATAQGVLGEKALAIPFAVKKQSNSFGFVVWVNEDGTSALSDVSPMVVDSKVRAVTESVSPSVRHALADGPRAFCFGSERQTFTVSGTKWVFPRQQKRLGAEDPNPHGVKLTYTAKTGVVKGKLSLPDSTTGKTVKYTVNGVVVGDDFFGCATSRGRDPLSVRVE